MSLQNCSEQNAAISRCPTPSAQKIRRSRPKLKKKDFLPGLFFQPYCSLPETMQRLLPPWPEFRPDNACNHLSTAYPITSQVIKTSLTHYLNIISVDLSGVNWLTATKAVQIFVKLDKFSPIAPFYRKSMSVRIYFIWPLRQIMISWRIYDVKEIEMMYNGSISACTWWNSASTKR